MVAVSKVSTIKKDQRAVRLFWFRIVVAVAIGFMAGHLVGVVKGNARAAYQASVATAYKDMADKQGLAMIEKDKQIKASLAEVISLNQQLAGK